MPEATRPNRRRFCGATAAAAPAGALGLLSTAERSEAMTEVSQQTLNDATAIRPFRVNVPEADLSDLRGRINATRWPDRETVTEPFETSKRVAALRHARLAGLGYRAAEDHRTPHESDGTRRKRIRRLSSGDSVDTGLRFFKPAGRSRLGYRQFVAQGEDVGALVTTAMAVAAPPELLGMHTNFPGTTPPDVAQALQRSDPPPTGLSADEKRAYAQEQDFKAKHFAYAVVMSSRPQTLYGLADSPVALATWLCDHGDGWGQPAPPVTSAVLGRTIDGHDAGDLTRDDVLDNITLYWLTNTGISAARLYWENKGMSVLNAVSVSIPAAVSIFPGEIYQAPRSWTERAYHKLIYYHQVAKGGHFAAWEQQLFSEELRAGFRPLRR
jgi:hypothetical protein